MALELDRIRQIAERVAADLGVEVVETQFRGGGKSRMLRIVIDRADTTAIGGGVTHEDCANLSRQVSTILDVEDAVPGGSYMLEVSSPGLDRNLTTPRDFERFTGGRIKLTTREPIEGNRVFEGRLESFSEGRLTLDTADARRKNRPKGQAGRKMEIELSNVEKANLVPEI